MVTVQVSAAGLQAIMSNLKSQAREIFTNVENAKAAISNVYTQGSRLLGLLLGNLEKTAWVQNVMAVQQVIMAGISMKMVIAQAAASFAQQNYISGAILTTIAGTMGYNLAAAEIAKIQADRLMKKLESMQLLRESMI